MVSPPRSSRLPLRWASAARMTWRRCAAGCAPWSATASSSSTARAITASRKKWIWCADAWWVIPTVSVSSSPTRAATICSSRPSRCAACCMATVLWPACWASIAAAAARVRWWKCWNARIPRIVGRFMLEHGMSFVVPSNSRINQDIAIPPEHRAGAVANQIVEVEIIEQPSKRAQPIGRIAAVLGDHMAAGMEVDIAVRSYNLPHEWPAEVLAEIAPLTAEVPEHAKRGREDLRSTPLVTIDGEDARDFDDAVYCEPHGKGWRLLVALADVSTYVNIGTALDDHARLRGTSVYFPGRVIPMLPEILSNGLCSLNPHVDRLCHVCEMSISSAGEVRGARIFEAVMRSAARLTYTEVAAAVEERNVMTRDHVLLVLPQLDNLIELYKVLRARRDNCFVIDLETTETKI